MTIARHAQAAVDTRPHETTGLQAVDDDRNHAHHRSLVLAPAPLVIVSLSDLTSVVDSSNGFFFAFSFGSLKNSHHEIDQLKSGSLLGGMPH